MYEVSRSQDNYMQTDNLTIINRTINHTGNSDNIWQKFSLYKNSTKRLKYEIRI